MFGLIGPAKGFILEIIFKKLRIGYVIPYSLMARPTAVTHQCPMLKCEHWNRRHKREPASCLGWLHWPSRFFPWWEGLACLAILMWGLEVGWEQFHRYLMNLYWIFQNALEMLHPINHRSFYCHENLWLKINRFCYCGTLKFWIVCPEGK